MNRHSSWNDSCDIMDITNTGRFVFSSAYQRNQNLYGLTTGRSREGQTEGFINGWQSHKYCSLEHRAADRPCRTGQMACSLISVNTWIVPEEAGGQENGLTDRMGLWDSGVGGGGGGSRTTDKELKVSRHSRDLTLNIYHTGVQRHSGMFYLYLLK